jgi:hypothetical protein
MNRGIPQNAGNLIDWLGTGRLLKKDSATWSEYLIN